jgi:thiol-disulfide isomerase/thioredoxin
MSIRSISVLIILLLALQTTNAQDFKVKKYIPGENELALQAALDTTEIYSDRLEIGRHFRDQFPNDIPVQMRVADLLAVDNPDAVRDYYTQRAKNEPDNIIAQFLAGRVASGPALRQEYANAILVLDPKSYWGKLLQAASYFPEDDADLSKTEATLREAIAIDNSKQYAVSMLAELLVSKQRLDEADNVFSRLSEMMPGDFEPVQRRLVLIPGDFQRHLKILNDFLEENPKHVMALDVRARVYRETGNWDGYIESLQQAAAAEHQGVDMYNLACGFSMTGQIDSAFTRLFAATDAGFSDATTYSDDDDLLPLHDDPRWTELLSKVEVNHMQELVAIAKEQQRELPKEKEAQAVERTQSKMAPDFTAKTFDGKEVSLSDLRGKIVIIDFWATWCGPCRRTMPLLDKFYKDERGEDVEVYGINVWERGGTEKVQPFIEKEGYRFPILLADNEVASRYGVSGIPTMFVIDKEGRVAYKHVGYNPQIISILSAQTKELSEANAEDKK